MTLYDDDGIDGPFERGMSGQQFMHGRSESDRLSWALECLDGDFVRCGRLKRGRIKRLAAKLGLREEMLRDAWANLRLP